MRGNAGGNGCVTISCSASPCSDMPVQSFETNRQYWAVLKRIRSLMLMFCRMQPVVCMQSKQRPGTFIVPCKTINFQHIDSDKLTCNLHLAFCGTNWSNLVGSSSHIIHSIIVHDQNTQVLQILLVNYILAAWFRLTLLDQWFSGNLCCHLVKLLRISQH